MEPIVIINNTEPVKKSRLVEIYKNNVFKDIDLRTYKNAEANPDREVRANNAIASDVSEDMDGSVVARFVELRDAELRKRLQHSLAPTDTEYATDEITLEDNKYRYQFVVTESFKDNTLRSLAEHIHWYLVYGALYDWYGEMGMMQQAGFYQSKMDTFENSIDSLLRGPSIAKRPLQPFGPAQKLI